MFVPFGIIFLVVCVVVIQALVIECLLHRIRRRAYVCRSLAERCAIQSEILATNANRVQ